MLKFFLKEKKTLLFSLVFLFLFDIFLYCKLRSNKAYSKKVFVNQSTLNEIFKRLYFIELEHFVSYRNFQLISLSEIKINLKNRLPLPQTHLLFQHEIKKYLTLSPDDYVQLNEEFFKMALELNEKQTESLETIRQSLVLVTYGKREFSFRMKKLIELKKTYFPSNKLIVYDLGMDGQMLREINASCEIKPFRTDSFPVHFKNLKTLCWKPVFIQVRLNN